MRKLVNCKPALHGGREAIRPGWRKMACCVCWHGCSVVVVRVSQGDQGPAQAVSHLHKACSGQRPPHGPGLWLAPFSSRPAGHSRPCSLRALAQPGERLS